jgi:hypothetical protein
MKRQRCGKQSLRPQREMLGQAVLSTIDRTARITRIPGTGATAPQLVRWRRINARSLPRHCTCQTRPNRWAESKTSQRNHSISHQETVMNRPIPFDATPALKRALGTVAERRFALWTFVAMLIVTACAVLILDASITPEQRIALFEQSGFFP